MESQELARLFESTGKAFAMIHLTRSTRQRWMEANHVETVQSQPGYYDGHLVRGKGRLVVVLFIKTKTLRDRLLRFGYHDVTSELRGEPTPPPAPEKKKLEIIDDDDNGSELEGIKIV